MESNIEASQLFRLEKRTILMTGGLGGIGLILCKTLLEYGADVVCTDLAEAPAGEPWNEAQTLAQSLDLTISYLQLDVTNSEAVRTVFEKVNETVRYPLRGLICCAGRSDLCPALDYEIERFRKVTDNNITGTFLAAQAAARVFHQRNVPGAIVILASMSGYVVNQGVTTSAYNSSKAALHQLGRSLAAEWGNDKSHPPVRVNTLSPGYIRTAATESTLKGIPGIDELWSNGNMLGRLSYAHEFRAPILFLLSDANSFMTGADLRVDGGHCAW